MFKFLSTTAILAFVTAASASSVNIINSCSFLVDPAFSPEATLPNGTQTGGFVLSAGASTNVTLPSGWNGRIWPRTGCDASGNCQTGNCAGGLSCTGYGAPNSTFLGMNIDAYAGADYFTPAANDGFNVPLTFAGCGQAVSCSSAGDTSNGCGATGACATGTAYTLTFC